MFLIFPVRVEHVSCVVENLESAIKGPETFCDTCKRKGVPKKTANVYCAICKKKYCAKHAEVSVCQLFVTFLHPAPLLLLVLKHVHNICASFDYRFLWPKQTILIDLKLVIC